jgi:ABC-2 type transport system ATP-binding protein
MPAAIVTLGLHKTYRSVFGADIDALHPLDLTVEQGEIFGLLGPNGAGKTTLVKLLLGIAIPSGGEGRILGRSIRDAEARETVGFLPESHRFPDYLTAAQVLDHYGRIAGVDPDERARRIPDLLDRVRMGKWADTRVRKFSKGMMQRLGLAQALLNAPELVFLDEPTDGVDPVGRREIRDLLLDISREGTTIFLNSHLLSEVEQVCTRVAILKSGRLARLGTIDELTTQDRVYELRCTPLPGSLAPETAELFRPLEADPSDGDAALDALRAHAVELESVRPLRQSLEDFFVEVVAEPEGVVEPAASGAP